MYMDRGRTATTGGTDRGRAAATGRTTGLTDGRRRRRDRHDGTDGQRTDDENEADDGTDGQTEEDDSDGTDMTGRTDDMQS